MTPIEKQILDNQRKIMMFLCNGNEKSKDEMIGNLMVTGSLLDVEESEKEEEPCCEMPEREIEVRTEEDNRTSTRKITDEIFAISKTGEQK